NIIAAALLRYFLSDSGGHDRVAHAALPGGPTLSAYRDRVYLKFIGCTILFASCFFQLFTTLPVFYKRSLHMPEYMIGLLMAMNGLFITLFEMVLVFKMEGKRAHLVYIFFGVMLVAISFALLDILPLSILLSFGCMLIVTIGEILAMPFMNSFWISRTVPANRGQYAGLYTMAWSTAQVIGPAGGSQVAEYFSFRTLWWIIGGIGLLSALGFRYLSRSKPAAA
ncbi:MAG: MFS transporter, partial [Bacteroidota bacterium]|nr:MFS transporter [Bacteroidota bacterium]